MIRLSSKVLSGKTETHLSEVQARVDVQADFAAKANRAKTEWESKTSSKTKRAAFDEIKETLLSMCVGTEICNYCENNEATDIEHIYPKSFFPERAFRWDNYLLACKTCNSTYKLDRFAVFDPSFPNKKIELSRGSGQPANDDGVIVDPRSENPLEFFWLDIKSRTFVLDPKLGLPPHDLVRARYTIDLLGLNDRAALVAARKRAASYYIDRLERYVRVKETENMGELLNAVPEPYLVDETLSFEYEQARIKQALKVEIESCDHPTVWQELIRQRGDLRKTNDFLNRAPEALAW